MSVRIPNRPEIQAVLFDLSGVLTYRTGKTKSLYKAIKDQYGVSKKDLKAEIRRRGYEELQGQKLAVALQEPLAAMIGRPIAQDLGALIPEPEFHRENLELVRSLHSRYKTAIVANSDGFVEDRLIRAGLRDLFDAVIDSEVIGCSKPDARIYELTLARLKCEARHSVFVDDKQENIEAAQRLGMTTMRYSLKDGDDLARRLATECGVAVPSQLGPALTSGR